MGEFFYNLHVEKFFLNYNSESRKNKGKLNHIHMNKIYMTKIKDKNKQIINQ